MDNEKMKILKMLEDGKISAADAARLLESSGGSSAAPSDSRYNSAPSAGPDMNQRYYQNQNHYQNQNQNDYRNQSYQNANQGPKQSATFESFADDLGRKFETFVRDMEPRIQKFSNVVAEKTAVAADKISKSMTSPPSPRRSEPYATAPMGNRQERNFEIKVSEGFNELNIRGFNGQVLLRGYNGDKISAKILFTPRRGGFAPELMSLGNKYFLNYEDDDFEMVAIDAFIPEFMFNNIAISVFRGSLTVSNLSADFVQLDSTDGNVDVSGIRAKNFKLDSNNGSVRLASIISEKSMVEVFNGNLETFDTDMAQLKLNAYNGSVVMNIREFKNYSDYIWSVESSNGKMTLNLPSSYSLGYHIKAYASLGQLRVGLIGLSYMQNDRSAIEAKSIDYDRAETKVKLSLETSNASLTVN